MINNKKGFLLGEETVKLILAVIAILFLILFIVFLYNNFSKDQELEQAKASLDYLITQIKSGAAQAEIFNPKDWGVVSFPFGDDKIPKSCSSVGWESCICSCKPEGNIHTTRLACLATSRKITCLENDFAINPAEGIVIANPPLILSINQNDKIVQEGAESGA
ncbi:MAG: hypothetical protein PHH00_03705 [Candidatus Nanoarchaeia archaeon]|nr:hypothetical protein [Candidatus Nanoarchaeia archaeon]